MDKKPISPTPGGLEVAYIEKRFNDKCALGRSRDYPILVNNGSDQIGKECLVRFDLKQKNPRGKPFTNYITDDIPPGFTPLRPEEYVLCGIWTPAMHKPGVAPTFDDFHQFYDPGHAGYFYFLKDNSTKRRGRFRVNLHDATPQRRSYLQILKGLPDPNKNSRVIIAEGKDELEKIMDAITTQSLIPILMDRIINITLNHAKT